MSKVPLGYAKVTITFETDKGDVTTCEIPMARNIVIESSAIEIREGFLPKQFLTDSSGFNLGLIADFDDRVGYIMRELRTSTAKPVDPKPVEVNDAELHAMANHPDYEYRATEGQRKNWADVDTTPPGHGWSRNVEIGRGGWERFDYIEESYWKRPRKWKDFEKQFDMQTQDEIMRFGPTHPDHPNHQHEDCCK